MGRKTDALVRELDRNIERLERDLKKLRGTRRVILALEAPDETPMCPKPKKLVDAVALALDEIGPATSADVVDWLRKNWDPDVNPSSARSTLSGYKGKRFENDGRKWWRKSVHDET